MRAVAYSSLLALVIASCGELPEPAAPIAGTQHDDTTDPTDPILDPTAPPPEAPALSSAPGRYGYDTLPVRGLAAPWTTIFVEGGQAPVATDTDAGGDFCVDVPLAPSRSQVLDVYAQDQRGLTSEPASLSVTQDPSLAEVLIPEQPLAQLAPGAAVFSEDAPKEGWLASVTDDDPTTSVLVHKTFIWIDLGDTYDLEAIEIEFPDAPGVGDNTFATEYQVLASAEPAPILPPDASDPSWTLIFDVYPGSLLPAGDGGVDTFALATPLLARYIGFYLIENNKTDWFSTENIRVSEVRTSGRSTEPLPPVPQTPTCENGRTP